MKNFRRLLPGRKKTKKQEGDRDHLSNESNNSDHYPSPEPTIENSNLPPASFTAQASGTSLPVIPPRRGNTHHHHDVRFNTEDAARTTAHSNSATLAEETSLEAEGRVRQDTTTAAMKEQWHTAQNGNSAANNTTANLGDHLGATSDRIPVSRKLSVGSTQSDATVPNIFDDAPNVVLSYDAVPLLEQTKLPRGGVSMETQSVGRVQVRSSIQPRLYCRSRRCYSHYYSCLNPQLFTPSYSLVSLQKQSRTVCVLV